MLLLPFVALTDSPPLANSTILIIRHAEKPKEGRELTPQGEARAHEYVRFFEKLHIDGHAWKATHLFAAADSKDSERPRLTLTPLSEDLRMPLDTRFGSKEVESFVADLTSHSYGKEILICWRHGKIPAMVEALGGKTDVLFPTGKWPEDVYDWMIELKFGSDGKLKKDGVKLLHEHLMPGDSQVRS